LDSVNYINQRNRRVDFNSDPQNRFDPEIRKNLDRSNNNESKYITKRYFQYLINENQSQLVFASSKNESDKPKLHFDLLDTLDTYLNK
jgi:hypothetical protein